MVIPAGGYPMLLFGREPAFTIDGATVLNGLPVAVLRPRPPSGSGA